MSNATESYLWWIGSAVIGQEGGASLSLGLGGVAQGWQAAGRGRKQVDAKCVSAHRGIQRTCPIQKSPTKVVFIRFVAADSGWRKMKQVIHFK